MVESDTPADSVAAVQDSPAEMTSTELRPISMALMDSKLDILRGSGCVYANYVPSALDLSTALHFKVSRIYYNTTVRHESLFRHLPAPDCALSGNAEVHMGFFMSLDALIPSSINLINESAMTRKLHTIGGISV